VRTELACDPLEVDPDQLAPLALFAVEAISNARKHGLAHDGLLSVRFAVRGAEAELSITDTGHAPAAAKMGPGVGRTLMTAFARQLRGEVSYRANPGAGLTARLIFPLAGDEPLAPSVAARARRAAV